MVFGAASFVLGLIVGSFLNVVIHRVPYGTFFSAGRRSHCPHCDVAIAWYDNLPLISWLVLCGKGRCCGQKISARYPAVEVLTGIAFFLIALRHESSLFSGASIDSTRAAWSLFDFWLVGSLIAASAIDIQHRILPDVINFIGIGVGFVAALVVPEAHAGGWLASTAELQPSGLALLNASLGCVLGAGSLYLVGVLGKVVYRTEAMGLGDVKFMAFTGAFIGPDGVLTALLVACVVGAVVGLISTIRTGDPLIPFGPFLAIGVLVGRFWRDDMGRILTEEWPRWVQGSRWGLPVMGGMSLLSLGALFLLRRRRRRRDHDESNSPPAADGQADS